MIPLLTAAQVRELDRIAIDDIGLPGVVLMEGAGRALAREVEAVLPEPGHVAVLCGKGNNGGDGFVAARILAELGYHVVCFLAADAEIVAGDARVNLAVLNQLDVTVIDEPIFEMVTDDRSLSALDKMKDQLGPVLYETLASGGSLASAISHAEVIVDALLGTGASGPPRGLMRELVEAIAESDAMVIACDLPTGVDSDTGQVHEPHVVADRTCSFAAWKIGLAVGPGAVACGQVSVHDIGIPHLAYHSVHETPILLEAADVALWLPDRPADLHKGEAGRVVILGGSPGFGGAPLMAATAALKAGAGLVTVGLPDSLADLLPAVPIEAMCRFLPSTAGGLTAESLEPITELLKAADAAAVGPGLGTAEGAGGLLRQLSRQGLPVVFDADALNILAADPKVLGRRCERLLTPHPGEAARLLNCTIAKVQADRLGAAQKLALQYDATVVLKGYHSIVAHRDEAPAVIPTGTPAMATGGMGDALTGVLVALLGQGVRPYEAACLAVWLHGAAGELAADGQDCGLRVVELIESLPAARAALLAVE